MTRRVRTERGTALVEVTWLAVLLLVPLVYLVLAVFDVQRSAFAVNAATRAADVSVFDDQTPASDGRPALAGPGDSALYAAGTTATFDSWSGAGPDADPLDGPRGELSPARGHHEEEIVDPGLQAADLESAAGVGDGVAGRPAAIGAVMPGKITVPRSGRTGRVCRVAIPEPWA